MLGQATLASSMLASLALGARVRWCGGRQSLWAQVNGGRLQVRLVEGNKVASMHNGGAALLAVNRLDGHPLSVESIDTFNAIWAHTLWVQLAESACSASNQLPRLKMKEQSGLDKVFLASSGLTTDPLLQRRHALATQQGEVLDSLLDGREVSLLLGFCRRGRQLG